MDNTLYTGKNSIGQGGRGDFITAIKELRRILKFGGKLYCTFPFGKYENHGWFQQFDSKMTDTLVNAFTPLSYKETIFKYTPDGWIISDRASCSKCEFFDVHISKYFDSASTVDYPDDYPAGERAVACLELEK
jgi:hypothetical protein